MQICVVNIFVISCRFFNQCKAYQSYMKLSRGGVSGLMILAAGRLCAASDVRLSHFMTAGVANLDIKHFIAGLNLLQQLRLSGATFTRAVVSSFVRVCLT